MLIVLGLIALIVIYVLCRPKDAPVYEELSMDSTTALAIEEGYVAIYYVDGDQIQSEEQYLFFRGDDIFEAWKQKNGIGDEVKKIRSLSENNGEESTYEFQGQTIVSYTMGDYHTYTLVVSSELEAYFATLDRELLLQSLEQTMTGYLSFEYDEIHIHIE